MNRPLCNLFIPGAQKSATTTVAGLLATHPDIYTGPRKEPHFFSIESRLAGGVAKYRRYYRSWAGERYILDASQSYLPLPFVPERMARLLGTNLKFIVVLRHPVDRTVSAFTHMRLRPRGELVRSLPDIVPANLDRMTLADLLEWEANEVRRCLARREIIGRHDTWTKHLFPFTYFHVSTYAEQIENFHQHFAAANFLFLTFDEVIRQPEGLRSKLAAFLDIDPAAFPASPLRQRNETLQYRTPALQYLYWLRGPLRGIVPEPLAERLRRFEHRHLARPAKMRFEPQTYSQLCRIFAEEVDRVAALTGLKLDGWRSRTGAAPL